MTGRMVNWTKSDYEAETERMRASRLKPMWEPQGPRAFYWSEQEERGETEILTPHARSMGILLHELAIEGHQNWVVYDGKRDIRQEGYRNALRDADWTVEMNEQTSKWEIRGEGKALLKKEESNLIWNMREGLLRNAKARELIEGPRFGEQVILWEEDLGFVTEEGERFDLELPCKASVDLWGTSSMGCLKSTVATDERSYRREVRKWKTAEQAAFYLRGRNKIPELAGTPCRFFHLVVMKSHPHYAYVWELSRQWLKMADSKVLWALELISKCKHAETLLGPEDPVWRAWPDFLEAAEIIAPDMWMMEEDGWNPDA